MVSFEPVYINIIREGREMTVEVTGRQTAQGFINISATNFGGETISLTQEEAARANGALQKELDEAS